MVEDDDKRSILLIAIAAVVGTIGLGIAVGGVWLIALGGSWYYLIAGGSLIVTALLLIRRMPSALWFYAALLLGTMAWALWEVGLDFWALAPRGDLLAILGVVLVLPWVVKRLGSRSWPGPAWPLVVSLGLAGLVAVGAAVGDPHDLKGSLLGPRVQVRSAL